MFWINFSYLVMLITMVGWGYPVLLLLHKTCQSGEGEQPNLRNRVKYPIFYSFIMGLIILTIFTQFISLFSPITYHFAFLFLLIALILIGFFYKSLWNEIKNVWKEVNLIEVILILLFLVAILLFTSLYPTQYDNYLYQSQIVRYYEEYGYIKGAANINTRVGFNNSIYAIMALYSFKGIYGFSLHTVNSALCLFMGINAIHGLFQWKKHRYHAADALRIAFIGYVFSNVKNLNCIGTDVPAMCLAFAIFILFLSYLENHEKQEYFQIALIALAVVYTVTLKFSVGILLLLVILPAYLLIKQKRWKEIVIFISFGILILLPFLIRNVLISGWILYPNSSIDLFDVKWKVPENIAYREALAIRAWARINTSKFEQTMATPLREWMPGWFSSMSIQSQWLLRLQIPCLLFEIFQFIYAILKKQKEVLRFYWVKIVIFIAIIFWFYTAPDIRFASIYLISAIILTIPTSFFVVYNKKKIATHCVAAFCIIVIMFTVPYRQVYSTIKTSIVGRVTMRPFYIYQADYSAMNVLEYKKGEMIFYYPESGDQSGYYGFPGATNISFLEHLEFLGDTFEDGVYSTL